MRLPCPYEKCDGLLRYPKERVTGPTVIVTRCNKCNRGVKIVAGMNKEPTIERDGELEHLSLKRRIA